MEDRDRIATFADRAAALDGAPSAKPKFNFADLDTEAACNKPFKLEFRTPGKGLPMGCGVLLLGKDSTAYRDFFRNRVNDEIRRNAMAEKRSSKPIDPKLYDEILRDGAEAVAICTIGFWPDTLPVGDEDLPYSFDNAVKLYQRFDWARQQADEAIQDLTNFTTA